MPVAHHSYDTGPPSAAYELFRAEAGPPAGSPEWQARMAAVGRAFRRAQVAEIVLVHGTFVGDDPLGLAAELEGLSPAVGKSLRQTICKLTDAVVRERGNYTADFAQQFAVSLGGSDDENGSRPPIAVRLSRWSGENHHLARLDAAVRLIDELAGRPFPAHSRVLLWGHSHGGNVLALLSSLLSGPADLAAEVFDALEPFLSDGQKGGSTQSRSHWRRVRQLLLGRSPGEPLSMLPGSDHPLLAGRLDLVTFGTPLRYGWGGREDPSRLLHFVNHRPAEGLPPYQAPFPPRPGGDVFQQLGIAGTNLPPALHSRAALQADRRLASLLQPQHSKRQLWQRLRAGIRVAGQGTTLLVDYPCSLRGKLGMTAGHSLYTKPHWLLFHAEHIARRFYDEHGARR